MSFSSAFQSGERFTESLLSAKTLSAMAQSVIVLLGAGLLAAIYHAANEEAVNIIKRIRLRSHIRQARHETLLMMLLGNDTLDAGLQDYLLRSCDAFAAALALLAHPILTPSERELMREALIRCSGRFDND